jgi:hypothetical protein
LRDADWGGLWEELKLADILVCATYADGVAYTGFTFNGMAYEHGLGVVLRGSRVVYFGLEDISDELSAQKDLRRMKRIKRTE